jgi:subtilase family serine protease
MTDGNRIRRCTISIVLALGTALASFIPIAPSPTLAAGRQQLTGHVLPEFAQARMVGRLPAATQLYLAIGLPVRNESELDALLVQLYDPASPQYRRFLTSAELTERFSPTEADYAAVTAFARAQGLAVGTYANRALLAVTGSASQIEKAFNIRLVTRRRPNNSIFFAPDREPSLDLDVAILHVSGLDNYVLPHRHISAAPKPGPLPADGVQLVGGSVQVNPPVYGAPDLRNAYVPGVKLTGQGQTVGLYEADGFYNADIQAYKTKFGLRVPVQTVLAPGGGFSANATQSGPPKGGCPPAQITATTRPAGTPLSGNVETALDIDMAMAMAPGLQGIFVYEGCTTDGVLNAMLSPPPGVPVSYQLSASYTFGTTANSQKIVKKMAAQGQSLFVIAGDNRAICTSFPAEAANDSRRLSNVTVVGGTILQMNGSGASWESETAATDGGGVLTNTPIPAYQKGLATPANGGSTQWRMIPDVSAVSCDGGNCSIFIYANNGQVANQVGTSAAGPLWAGYLALVNEQAQNNGSPRMGFINPAIYAIGGNPEEYPSDFHDITSGGSVLPKKPCKGYIGYNATPGYDLVTGWGSPTADLINQFSPPPPPPPPPIPDCGPGQKWCTKFNPPRCTPEGECLLQKNTPQPPQ